MAGLFRKAPIVQLQVRPGSFGSAGAAGAPGANGPAGAQGAAGAAGLGPTVQRDLNNSEINALNGTPIDVIPAVVGTLLVPVIFWTEQNVTVAGTNACAYNFAYPTGSVIETYSASLNSSRNAGNRGMPNYGTVVAAFGDPLPTTGVAFRVSLSAVPTGPPTATARVFMLYYELPALIP